MDSELKAFFFFNGLNVHFMSPDIDQLLKMTYSVLCPRNILLWCVSDWDCLRPRHNLFGKIITFSVEPWLNIYRLGMGSGEAVCKDSSIVGEGTLGLVIAPARIVLVLNILFSFTYNC